MRSGLEARGFRVSENDPVFIHDDKRSLISWVDDATASRDVTKIESMNLKVTVAISTRRRTAFNLRTKHSEWYIHSPRRAHPESYSLPTNIVTQQDTLTASTTTLGSDKDGARWVDADEPFECTPQP
jgi:hypothetical protein